MSHSDPTTLKTVVTLIRSRMDRLSRNKCIDGLERLGAYRAPNQLTKDLDATVDEFSRGEKS